MGVTRIVSGGQCGADQGALEAGCALKIETGGWAPRGWLTEFGSARELLMGYGLKAHDAVGYPARTRANVRDSDGTVIFGTLESPGSRLTWAECVKRQKPVLHISQFGVRELNLETFRLWLLNYAIQTLNVAGNRESKALGLQVFTRDFLLEALTVR